MFFAHSLCIRIDIFVKEVNHYVSEFLAIHNRLVFVGLNCKRGVHPSFYFLQSIDETRLNSGYRLIENLGNLIESLIAIIA